MIDEGAEVKEEMYSPLLLQFRDKLSEMNMSQKSVEETGILFINAYKNDHSSLDDLLTFWKEATALEKHVKNCPFLADFILKSCESYGVPEIKESFYPYIREAFPFLYSTLNSNVRKDLELVVEGWRKQEIYPQEKIDEIKFLMMMEFSPEIHGSDFELNILTEEINSQKYTINENCLEFAKMKEQLDENPEDRNLRELTLQKCKAVFNEENQTFKEHTKMLEELDRILAKIKQYKRQKEAAMKSAANN